ncbi:hypothetical protein NP603_14630 [Methylomonas sp. SURF-1]|uniref:Uncharacterized protein n=1 Tax=Methylomonas aurea TaxID=2952224 RepID=A0ABT1UJD3_9GAMM|nr:hypothetical protein [Methylomonas sp. SURF-1]MCQ8182354.1 hypothetical protein [Methylomonas sp. SURF-1]
MSEPPLAAHSITLSEQINQNFFMHKGYEVFANLKSHDAVSLFDSYFLPQKTIASSITHQPCQISFIGKFLKLG